MNEDAEINLIKNIQSIPGEYSESVDKLMGIISAPFHFKIFTLLVLFLYFIGKITTQQIFIICSSQIVIFTIKCFVKRKRPFEVNKNIQLKESMSYDPYSFPSGHTLNAVLLSFILRKNIGVNLNILPYLVGLSRVYLGVHYPSDIIGGFLLTKIILNSF